jgi:hypothetical protein
MALAGALAHLNHRVYLELIKEIHLDQAATFLSSHLAPNLAAHAALVSHILRSALGHV